MCFFRRNTVVVKMERQMTFDTRARSRGLVIPTGEDDFQPVIWDGKTMHLVKGESSSARENLVYHPGESMVGHVEQPCASTTRLICGQHRFINAPAPTKNGSLWKPGNRYNARVRSTVINACERSPVRSAWPSCVQYPVVLFSLSIQCDTEHYSMLSMKNN
jgi:hypothetical protein